MKNKYRFWENISPTTNNKLQCAIRMKGYKELSKFAEECGFSRPFISKIVHGKVKPDLSTAQIISNKLGLMITDVFRIEELKLGREK